VSQLDDDAVTVARDAAPERVTDLREELRATLELNTRLIESSRDCIKVLDLDGKLLSMNSGGMEVLEICDLAPFLHTSWIDFWEGEDREKAAAAVAAARLGEIGRFVGYFATQTGKPRWWDVVVSAILDAAGRPHRLLALSRDVTDQQRAERILRDSKDELERLVEERTAALERANFALQSEASERRRAEVTLRTVVEGVEAETGDRFFVSLVQHLTRALGVAYAFIAELSADGTRFHTRAVWGRGAAIDNFEVPLAGSPCEAVLRGKVSHHPSGLIALFPLDVGLVSWSAESYCGVPMIDSNGSVIGHLAIFDDKPMEDAAHALSLMRVFATRVCAEIERLHAEAALRESEERLSRVLASAMDAIVTTDEQGSVVLFNAAAEKIFGCTAEEAFGQPVDRFLTPAFRLALDRALRALDGGGAAPPYVWAPEGLTAYGADGHEFPIEATVSRAETGGRHLYTLILRDVEERRAAEDRLRQLHLQNEYLQEEIRAAHNVDEIVGTSRAFRDALDKVALVAGTDASVLIGGETGTGKEIIARAIHSASKRCERPLIKVNCAALPTGLIESELFGHEKGAFTGAGERRIGRFELAHGGTIFLDEIGEIPPETQVKLLRVLQEREIERLGGSRTIAVDVRVIAATNRDLARAVAAGTFRQDLFYRLNVFPITLPPLRDRREDIPILVHYFVGRFAAKIGRRIARVPAATTQRLQAYDWPGNVRELENIIERAVILSPGPELHVDPAFLTTTLANEPRMLATTPIDLKATGASPGTGFLEDIERQHILAVLQQTNGRIEGEQGAARLLNLNPSTLRSRIKKLGIRRGFAGTS